MNFLLNWCSIYYLLFYLSRLLFLLSFPSIVILFILLLLYLLFNLLFWRFSTFNSIINNDIMHWNLLFFILLLSHLFVNNYLLVSAFIGLYRLMVMNLLYLLTLAFILLLFLDLLDASIFGFFHLLNCWCSLNNRFFFFLFLLLLLLDSWLLYTLC
jgi:hypothetical protein